MRIGSRIVKMYASDYLFALTFDGNMGFYSNLIITNNLVNENAISAEDSYWQIIDVFINRLSHINEYILYNWKQCPNIVGDSRNIDNVH